MTVSLLLCFVGVAVAFYALGVKLNDRKWMGILDKINDHYVGQLARVLAAPVYVANPSGSGEYEDDDHCPDCGEVHADDDDGDPDPEVN